MVVQKNLGSDSLQRWLELEFPEAFTFSRAATNKGYRVLRGRRRQNAYFNFDLRLGVDASFDVLS